MVQESESPPFYHAIEIGKVAVPFKNTVRVVMRAAHDLLKAELELSEEADMHVWEVRPVSFPV